MINKINYNEIKSHPFFNKVDFQNLKLSAEQEKEVSDTLDCSDQESSEEEPITRPSLNSFAVPCNMDEDDEDFYQNCFTNHIKIENKPRPYESFNCIPNLEDSTGCLLSFLKDDHFRNQQRKHSLR